ncbi:hypothetical protein GCM10025867_40110 [Frondihabitans sucicola]|uniref:Thiamine pyrophosphate enzyme N-terminal TPP-binding domain-containing protein n=1 Tax=Frondihabitans sucicola TaxID=1268041 RepID=A0ABM8GTH3_9MICO|nr:hypothetical protein GCM10025867_40110 [Frondihabitans sucicola]
MPFLPAPSGSPATDFSVVLLAELERAGVRDVVLSPGSRSQALALAAVEFERQGRLRLHVRLDERSNGFLALGLAVEQECLPRSSRRRERPSRICIRRCSRPTTRESR